MKTDIEYAALVMGFDDAELDAVTGTIITVHLPGMRCFWRPLEDDGDSRRLEAACTKWFTGNKPRPYDSDVWLANDVVMDAFATGDLKAIRAAVFALAVTIGKVMEGNDNAG